jgi:single-stranded DNA-binding protein
MTEQGINHNQVEVCGRINSAFEYSHEIFGEGFYTVKLLVNRLSEATDEIPLLISERLVDVTKDYRGMKIEVSGQFRSYNRHEGLKNKLILSIFVRELQFVEDDDMPQEQSKSNQIYLDGYVCKPPIYRKTPLGREIADILIAVNRPYGKSDYIPCIAWGRNARFASTIEVGGHLQVQGRVQSREYTKKISEEQVEKRVAYEVSVSKIDVVEEEEA